MIGTAAALLASGIAATAGQTAAGVIGSKRAAKGAREAANIEAKSAADALALQREQDAAALKERTDNETRRRQEWDAAEAARKQAWDIEQQRLAQEDARQEPYRQGRYAAYRSLAESLGYKVPDYQPVSRSTALPPNWKAGDPVPGATPERQTPSPLSGAASKSIFIPNDRGGMRTTLPPIVMADGTVVQPQNFSGGGSKLPEANSLPAIPEDGTVLGDAVRYRRQYQRSL